MAKGISSRRDNTWLEVVDFALQAEVTALNARVLPALPAEGSRDNKAAVFDGDNLVWETLMSGGLTSTQLARLLPALPASGSRNGKIAKV